MISPWVKFSAFIYSPTSQKKLQLRLKSDQFRFMCRNWQNSVTQYRIMAKILQTYNTYVACTEQHKIEKKLHNTLKNCCWKSWPALLVSSHADKHKRFLPLPCFTPITVEADYSVTGPDDTALFPCITGDLYYFRKIKYYHPSDYFYDSHGNTFNHQYSTSFSLTFYW
jgi:hypothetical protein